MPEEHKPVKDGKCFLLSLFSSLDSGSTVPVESWDGRSDVQVVIEVNKDFSGLKREKGTCMQFLLYSLEVL